MIKINDIEITIIAKKIALFIDFDGQEIKSKNLSINSSFDFGIKIYKRIQAKISIKMNCIVVIFVL